MRSMSGKGEQPADCICGDRGRHSEEETRRAPRPAPSARSCSGRDRTARVGVVGKSKL